MTVSSRILGPRVEGRTCATMKGHNARLAGSVFLIRIHPTDAIDLALFVVHAFDESHESPDGITRKRRSLSLVDVRKDSAPEACPATQRDFCTPTRQRMRSGRPTFRRYWPAGRLLEKG